MEDEDLREMMRAAQAACGHRQAWGQMQYCRDYCGYAKCPDVWVTPGFFVQGCGFEEKDAQHIANCSPERILWLCQRVLELEGKT